MKLNRTVGLVVLLAFWFVRPNASASGMRSYNFVEYAMEANSIALANSVARDGDNLVISVSEFVQGTGTKEFKVPIYPFERRTLTALDVTGERLVFLTDQGGQVTLVGALSRSIWPHSGIEIADSPAAKDVKALSRLCRQVRGSIQLSTQKRAELVAEMVSSPDFFVKGVGLQLCEYLYRQSQEKYKYEVQLGTAFGVVNMAEGRNHVFYPAMQLALLAPPSVVLPRLLEAMRSAPGRGQQNAAFYYLGRVSGTRGKFDFQDNTDKPDEKVRAEGLKAVTAWLDKERFRLITADAQQITDALKSEDAPTRMVGRVWLQSATGNDFGFKETGTADEMSAALQKVGAFLLKVRTDAFTKAQPAPTTR